MGARKQRSWFRTALTALLIGTASCLVVSCETTSDTYQRGYKDGYERGDKDGYERGGKDGYERGGKDGYEKARANVDSERTQSYQEGFKAGYESARPSARTNEPTGGLWIVVELLGMIKIILSLILFILILILDSKTKSERFAKLIATTLAALVVFWVRHIASVGLTERLAGAVLVPAWTNPIAKAFTAVVAAALAWLGLWFLEQTVEDSEGNAKGQTFLVFVASAAVTVLIPLFFSLLSAPNITGYLFFDAIVGVVMGGVFWIVQRLLAESTSASSILNRRKYYQRVFGDRGGFVR